MAALPPRKQTHSASPSNHKVVSNSRSMLDTLLEMGFSRSRAEKALAATGSRGVHIASDWLMAHINDQNLDFQDDPRHFYLYLCPKPDSELANQLQTFWDASRTQIGWNRAHNSPPHITVFPGTGCLGLKVTDKAVDTFVRTVIRIVSEFSRDFAALGGLELEKYASPNYVGLFVGKNQEILLRSLAGALKAELPVIDGVSVATSLSDQPVSPVSSSKTKESFHLTLAYQFLQSQFPGLQDLVGNLSLKASSEWEVRLYSSDSRLAAQDVDAYKVSFAHSPRNDDELELMVGDLVYINAENARLAGMAPEAGQDGWVIGTSWLTGCTGFLPKNYVERTADSNAWTLHCTIPLNGELYSGLSSCSAASSLERLRETTRPPSTVTASSKAPSNHDSNHQPVNNRQIFIVRHGERVDLAFGTWIPYSFDDNQGYHRKDLNMPQTVPKRIGGPEAFARDCPLTRIGCIEAQLTGEAMRETGVKISHVYVSPSLRCIETAHHVLKGLGSTNLKLHIEPGLFEWLAWYQDGMPDWMTVKDLVAAGYNVDENYEPYISMDELRDTQAELQQPESVDQFYTRNFFVTRCILQATEEAGGNLLFVAHACTLDTCSRQVTGHDPRTVQQMLNITRKVGYCGVAVLQEEENKDVLKVSSESLNSRRFHHNSTRKKKVWKLKEPPFPPLTYGGRPVFEWKTLLAEDPKKD